MTMEEIRRNEKRKMTDEEHARKYASESISLAISMYNPKAEDIAFFACLYGLTYKNDEIKELKQQIEKMKCDVLSIIKDRMNDDIDQNIIERLAEKWEIEK